MKIKINTQGRGECGVSQTILSMKLNFRLLNIEMKNAKQLHTRAHTRGNTRVRKINDF